MYHLNGIRCLRIAVMSITTVCGLLVTGCVGETSFPIRSTDLVPVRLDRTHPDNPLSLRQWLEAVHPKLQHLIPSGKPPALLTADLSDGRGEPVDVYKHFLLERHNLRSFFKNYYGLLHSVHTTGSSFKGEPPPPDWPGFKDVWIPVNEKLELSGRLGFAEKAGRIPKADCLVILPGIFGHNGIKRTHDLSIALREHGFHVLALELRGHGQTDIRHPGVFYEFGVGETGDLMAVSEWLEELPEVNRTGIIGFCWGANHSLLAAWYDGCSADDPSISPALRPHLRPRTGKRHYRAGVIAFSSVLRYEELIDDLDVENSFWFDPVLAGMQATVRIRMKYKKHEQPCSALRKLIEYEFTRMGYDFDHLRPHIFRFMRWLPYHGKPGGDKLESVRIPALIVHSANDPMADAQDLSDLISTVDNPNVAGLLLPRGGHIGLPSYARSYYFSLIANFFDPVHGAAAMAEAGATATTPTLKSAEAPGR